MKIKTLNDTNLKDKTVIVRLDWNVPMKNGQIVDSKRIDESLQTIKYLLNNNCKIIVLSHLSRIKKLEDIKNPNKSLKSASDYLKRALANKIDVKFLNKNTGNIVIEAVKNLKPSQILILENTRFNDIDDVGNIIKLESKNDPKLGKFWASLAQIFVNDAFGTAHRKHASNVGIASYISNSCIGLLMQKELTVLNKLIDKSTKPVIAILGGAKVSDKLQVINNLLKVADQIIIGGAMAFTFLKALGYNVGNSLVEQEMLSQAKGLLTKNPSKIILPEDFLCTLEIKADAKPVYRNINQGFDNLIGLDIGRISIKKFKTIINSSNTIFWNGPMGMFELSKFAKGTRKICEAIAKRTKHGAFSVIGGGDSAAAAAQMGFGNKFSFISTGGGASLAFIGGEPLPGVEAISKT